MRHDITMPAVNVTEKEDSWKMEAAVPGMEREDFDIKVDKGVLKISAEKKSMKEEKVENVMRKEFNYSSFSRSFWLPENVMVDQIEAHYENGILSVLIPKKEISVEKDAKVVKVN